MRVVHKALNKSLEGEARGEVSFLLGNKNFGYVSLSVPPRSRYEGAFFRLGKEVFRVVADLAPLNPKPVALVNELFRVKRIHEDGLEESFLLPFRGSSLIYELNREGSFKLVLDVRPSYVIETFGRKFSWEQREGCLEVTYEKFNPETDEKEYEAHLALVFEGGFEWLGEWVPHSYELDKKRGSRPSTLHVYNALLLKAKKLVLSFSGEREKARREALELWSRDAAKEQKEEMESFLKLRAKELELPEEFQVAYLCSLASLYQLLTQEGFVAGFPWFFQRWARDECVATLALGKLGKETALRNLRALKCGSLPLKHEEPARRSVDAVGWLFKWFEENLEVLSREEVEELKGKLMEAISCAKEKLSDGLLLVKEKEEQWMDTLPRIGARIEIQAMFLQMLDLAKRLGMEVEGLEELRKKVWEAFWRDDLLADGPDDPTPRPNVFIAYRLYPKLLRYREWKVCLKKLLEHLWLGWGGIASLSRFDKEFHPEHTGEDGRSYHRGDSWYWINNLFALVGLDFEGLRSYSLSVLRASASEILWQGAIGHASELSSAKRQSSDGCFAQAWSASTFVEAVEKLAEKLSS